MRPFGRQRGGTRAVLLSALMACSAGSVCFADATTAPSNLYDLTTPDAGRVDSYSSQYSHNTKADFAFDGSNASHMNRWLTKDEYSGWIVYKFNVPTVVDSIGIILPSAGNLCEVGRAPQDWTFEGSNDNSGWTVLDTQTGETGWTVGTNRYYKFSNTEAYQYYKFNCTTNNGETQLQIGELEFYCTGTGNWTWTGGGETSLVNDDANWGGAKMPGSENTASINNTGATPATIPAGLTVYKFMYLANGNGSSAKVEQTTGTLRLRDGGTFGRAGGSAEYAISGGKLVLDDTFNMSAKSGKSSSLLDISGDGEVVLSGALNMCTSGASAGSTARINISDSGKFSAAGEVKLGAVGNDSTGTVHQAGGTFSVNSNIMIGNEGSSQGLFEMTGGTLYSSIKLCVGRYGHGTFVASGADTVATAVDSVRVGFKNGNNIGYGTLIVTNDAKIVTKQICAGAGASYPDTAKVVFDGAVLTATASSTSSVKFLQDLCDITLGAGGLTINTENHNVTITNCTFNVTPGAKITVTGGGTVTFENTTVKLTGTPARAFTFAETDGAFAGLPTLSGAGKMKILGNSSRIVIGPPGLIFILR